MLKTSLTALQPEPAEAVVMPIQSADWVRSIKRCISHSTSPVKTPVDWVGLVHALFIDDNGLLREDSDQDGQLDGYAVDYVVDVSYDELSDTTLVTRFTSADGGATLSQVGDPVPLDQLLPIWNARDELARVVDVQNQRDYTVNAQTRRHILTSSGPGADGRISQAQVVDFLPQPFRRGRVTAGFEFTRRHRSDPSYSLGSRRGSVEFPLKDGRFSRRSR